MAMTPDHTDGVTQGPAVVEGTRTEARFDSNPHRNPLRLPLTALHFNTNHPERHARLMGLGLTKLDQVYALHRLGALEGLIGERYPTTPTVDRLSNVMNFDVHNEDPEGLARIKNEISAFAGLPIPKRVKVEIVRQLGYVTPREFSTITGQQLEMMELSSTMPPEEFSGEEIDGILAVAQEVRSFLATNEASPQE